MLQAGVRPEIRQLIPARAHSALWQTMVQQLNMLCYWGQGMPRAIKLPTLGSEVGQEELHKREYMFRCTENVFPHRKPLLTTLSNRTRGTA